MKTLLGFVFLKTQKLVYTLKNKMPELKIAFCVHQNAREISWGLVLYPGHKKLIWVFLFENMIIYDVLSALQFLFKFIIMALFLLLFFSYLLHYSSAVFIHLHICCFT